MRAYCSEHRVSTVDTSLSPERPPEIEILKKNFLNRKTKKLAYYSGHRVSTVDTSLSHVRPPDIEISKKNFLDRKTKMLTYYSGQRIDTFNLCDLQKLRYWRKIFITEKRKCANTVQGIELVQLIPPFLLSDLQKSKYWRKIFWTEKRKSSHTNQGIGLVPLTPPFHMCDPQISRYRSKIFWTEKRKCSHTIQGNWLVPLTCATSRYWDIEGKFLEPKNENARICSVNRNGTVHTSLSPERPSEIEISKKKFLYRKTKCAHTI